MKLMIFVLGFLISTGCGPSNSVQNKEQMSPADTLAAIAEKADKLPKSKQLENSTELTGEENQPMSLAFEAVTLFSLTDTIFADLNGDGKVDQTIFKKEKETSGIIITHGQSSEEIRIGFGKPFSHLNEFNWVDHWGLVNDSVTYEILVEDAEIIGQRRVKLENTSIFIRKEEAGGGLITWKHGKYEWIHQAH